MVDWQMPSGGAALLQALHNNERKTPPGHLWLLMQPPQGGPPRRVHSGLASVKLQRGWTITGEFLEDLSDNSVFPK